MNKKLKKIVRIITAAIIMALTICYVSCNSDNNFKNNIDLSQIYIIEKNRDILYKYNVVTGTYSPLCSDPICTHELWSDCKFAGAFTIRMDGEWVYFPKEDGLIQGADSKSKMHQSICSYNYVTEEYNILYKIEEISKTGFRGRFEYYDGYIYFYQGVPDPKVEEFTMSRINLKTKKVENLDWSYKIWHSVIIGNELIFTDGIKALFKTDVYFKNRVDLIEVPKFIGNVFMQSADNFVYYESIETDKAGAKSELCRVNIKTGENEILLETTRIAYFKIINDYMYYLAEDPEPQIAYVTDYGEKYYNRYGGKIYRARLDGSELEIYYENNEQNLNIKAIENCGKYLVVTYDDVVKKDGITNYQQSPKKIVFDMEAGHLVRS